MTSRRDRLGRAAAVSFAFHLTVAAALLVLTPVPPLEPMPEQASFEVDIVGPKQEARKATVSTPVPAATAAPTPSPEPPTPEPAERFAPPPTPTPPLPVPPMPEPTMPEPPVPPPPVPVPAAQPSTQPVAHAHAPLPPAAPARPPPQRAVIRSALPQQTSSRPAGGRAPVDSAGTPAQAFQGAGEQAAASSARAASNGAAWLGKLKLWWDQRSFYPKEASQTNEGGSVRVRIAIAADGQVLSIDVVQSSGSSVLDAAALAVFRNARLPPFPTGTPAPSGTVVLTLHYHPADNGG